MGTNPNKTYQDMAKYWAAVEAELDKLTVLAAKAQDRLDKAAAHALALGEQVAVAVKELDPDRVTRDIKKTLHRATSQVSRATAQVTKAAAMVAEVDKARLQALFDTKETTAPKPATEPAQKASKPAKTPSKAAKSPSKKAAAPKKAATKKAAAKTAKSPAKKTAAKTVKSPAKKTAKKTAK